MGHRFLTAPRKVHLIIRSSLVRVPADDTKAQAKQSVQGCAPVSWPKLIVHLHLRLDGDGLSEYQVGLVLSTDGRQQPQNLASRLGRPPARDPQCRLS